VEIDRRYNGLMEKMFAAIVKNKKAASYFSQLCVQPFLLGHKLQFLIEKSFFFGFNGEPGEVSTRISAGSPDSGHLTTFLERKSLPMGMNT
jgi:hypothetical protein